MVINLRFRRPHQRQYKYFSKKVAATISLFKASANMPKLNVTELLVASQLVGTRLELIQAFLSGSSKLLQSKKLGLHNGKPMVPFSLLHSVTQQVYCRSMDKRYHKAPRTCVQMLLVKDA